MNKDKCRYILLITIIVLLTSLNPFIFADAPDYFEIEKQLFQSMLEKGYTNSYAAISDEVILIRFDAEEIDRNLLDDLYGLTLLGYSFFSGSQNIIVEAYEQKKPIYSMTTPTHYISSMMNKEITEDELLNQALIEDIRPVEDVLRDDLTLFDTFIHDISIQGNCATIMLTYYDEAPHALINDFYAMALVTVEDIPWIEKVKFDYVLENGKKKVSLEAKTKDILSFLAEEITIDEFSEKIKSSEKTIKEEPSWLGLIRKGIEKIRTLPYGEWILQGLIVLLGIIVLLIVKMILFKIFGKSKKKQQKTSVS